MSRSYAGAGALTPALVRVLEGAAAGESAIETAGRLHVSPATVRSQRAVLVQRLGARNTANAIAIAYRFGLIE